MDGSLAAPARVTVLTVFELVQALVQALALVGVLLAVLVLVLLVLPRVTGDQQHDHLFDPQDPQQVEAVTARSWVRSGACVRPGVRGACGDLAARDGRTGSAVEPLLAVHLRSDITWCTEQQIAVCDGMSGRHQRTT